jgi:hypothetical protein
MKDGKLHVMSFGLGGNHGDGVSKDGNSYQSSWFLNGPDEFVEAIPGRYDPAEVNSYLVIDKREVVDKNPGLTTRAPLRDARLGAGEISRFNDKFHGVSTLMLHAFAQGNVQQRSLPAIAAYSLVAKIDGPGPLDYSALPRKPPGGSSTVPASSSCTVSPSPISNGRLPSEIPCLPRFLNERYAHGPSPRFSVTPGCSSTSC